MAGKDKQGEGKTVSVTVPAAGMRPAPKAKKAVNAGPLRGDNSFPASNKRRVNDVSRTVRTADADSRAGVGGKYGKGSDFEASEAADATPAKK
jgi:hypothetical protein